MKKIVTSTFVAVALLLFACQSEAQDKTKQAAISKTSNIEVVQFHLEHRCVGCTNIEKYTRATLANSFPAIPLTLIAVEKKENEKIAEQFQASGTSLFLHNKKTGAKKNLTQFAFLNVGNETKFQTALKQEIEAFQKL